MKSSDECPIALCIRDTSFCESVTVSEPMDAFIEIDGLTYAMPEDVQRFIDDFDAAVEVEPFEFELTE